MLDGLDADLFQGFGKADDIGGVIEAAAIAQPARPGKDRGDWVGRGFLTLLVLTVVPRDGAVRRLRLDCVAVRGQKYRGHHAERSEALRQSIGLSVAVVYLAG